MYKDTGHRLSYITVRDLYRFQAEQSLKENPYNGTVYYSSVTM